MYVVADPELASLLVYAANTDNSAHNFVTAKAPAHTQGIVLACYCLNCLLLVKFVRIYSGIYVN